MTHLKYQNCYGVVPQKIRVSLAKKRWGTKTRSSLLAPIEKPEIKPPFIAADII
jgi:hypothetical protein